MFYTQSSSFPTDEAPIRVVICGAPRSRMSRGNYYPQPESSRVFCDQGMLEFASWEGGAFFVGAGEGGE